MLGVERMSRRRSAVLSGAKYLVAAILPWSIGPDYSTAGSKWHAIAQCMVVFGWEDQPSSIIVNELVIFEFPAMVAPTEQYLFSDRSIALST